MLLDKYRWQARPIRIALWRVLTLTALFLPFSNHGYAQNSGNSTLASSTGAARVDESTTPRYSVDELTDQIERVDPQLAQRVRAAFDPQTGYLRMYESLIPRNGASDSGTIALPTTIEPRDVCAVILIHEFIHAERSHGAAPGDPDARDPALVGPCGNCVHAGMGADDHRNLCLLSCEPLPPITDLRDTCRRLDLWRRRIAEALTRCHYEGCPSCCGFSYVPNVDQLVTPCACCQA
jgi:hypothetical protein